VGDERRVVDRSRVDLGRCRDHGEPVHRGDLVLDAEGHLAGLHPARQIWVTETALTTALNTAYFAESMATFVAAMGGAVLLIGIGLLVLSPTEHALALPGSSAATPEPLR
jgi:hypothetical protein